MVCAMYPLGRCIEYDLDNPSKPLVPEQIQFIFSPPNCGTTDTTHTVRKWLDISGIPVNDKFFLKWQQFTHHLGNIIRNTENAARPDIMIVIWNMTFRILYLGYDTSKDFMPQFDRTCQELIRLMELLPTKKGKQSSTKHKS